MDFYNKYFYQLTRRVDPNGMLNVPLNIFSDGKCLDRYFKTNNDFRKLDVPWMCDQLVILLVNFEDVVASSTNLQFLQNYFQCTKYPFVLISQAVIGLILIHSKATKAYYSHCTNLTKTLYKNKIAVDKIPKVKKNKKPNSTNESHHKEHTQSQNIQSNDQHQVPSSETNQSEMDVILDNPIRTLNATEMNLHEINVLNQTAMPILHNKSIMTLSLNSQENIGDVNNISNLNQLQLFIQPIDEFPVIENSHLPKNDFNQQQMDIVLQPNNTEQPKYSNQQNTIEPLMEQPQHSINILDLQNPEKNPTENCSPEKNLTNQLLKRKEPSVVAKKKFKKRKIEQNSKLLKNRLKKLQGDLFDRPLEFMMVKYTNQTIDHLPIRYAMYRNKLAIPFAACTLNIELEKNQNLDDVFNNEMTMSSYQTIMEKFNYCNTSNICIYNHCKNNSLPHLTLISLVEECLTNNSLVWRDTINKINSNLEDSLREISPITKIDQNKWKKFKDKINYRVNQSLVAHKTLVGPELSHIDVPQPLMEFPFPSEIDKLLNDKTTTEHNMTEEPPINIANIHTMPSLSIITESGLPRLLPPEKFLNDHIEFNIDQENIAINRFGSNNLQNIQNVDEQVEEYHRQSIDIKEIISNILKIIPENISSLKFTDICPNNVTNRRYAISVFFKLLGLHKNGILKLSQPYNVTNPSSISIKIINYTFFKS